MNLDDCWTLEVSTSKMGVMKLPPAVWKEFKLPYDFGEPRCAHTASVVGILMARSDELEEQQLLIVGGLTQPFYETSMKLKVKFWCMRNPKECFISLLDLFMLWVPDPCRNRMNYCILVVCPDSTIFSFFSIYLGSY